MASIPPLLISSTRSCYLHIFIEARKPILRFKKSGVVGTPSRDRIWHAQTPQVFPAELVRRAYEWAARAGIADTDDSALVEAVGGEVVMVRGSPFNLKVTGPQDLAIADFFLRLGEG